MKNLILSATLLALFLISCEKDDTFKEITQGDYPVKEYYLERDPRVNVWGAGLDFVNSECKLTNTNLDYAYLTKSDTIPYDINFYVVKAYYYAENGDLKNEGCPAMLLAPDTKACKLGAGVTFFDSLTAVTEDMIKQLVPEMEVDYNSFKNDSTGFYNREALFAALDKCVIGMDFRGGVLEVPEGKREQDVQPVYLIKTEEGAFVKFMIKEFKPSKPKDKQTLVRWQVISE